MDIAQFVKETRASLGLTQAELAERIGCKTLWVSQVECGRAEPGPEFIGRLCKLAGINPRPYLVEQFAGRLSPDLRRYLDPDKVRSSDAANLPAGAAEYLESNPELAARLTEDGMQFLSYLCGSAGPPAPGEAYDLAIEYQEAVDCLDTIFLALIAPQNKGKRDAVLQTLRMLRDSVASPARPARGGRRGRS
ncbi:MAG TPA: helix-turn-helix domain-containing protein [Candidatus Brocadiia bacterium]|nr:helix-turn-helix domain-containing protein [Candidatus Brocadiia bacterium]